MGKNLLIIRHAKAIQYGYEDDFNRKLRKKGIAQIEKMSSTLAALKVYPDKIVSSAALRTKQTAEEFAKHLKYPLENIVLEQVMYDAYVENILKVINHLDNQYQTVFMIGHNPTFSYLADYLTGENQYVLPTCGMVNVYFQTNDWAEVSGGLGETVWFKYPKMFAEV